eukprot:14909.XXX_1202812_1203402_1 [CDS] Oithona nana genome sequencing.
MLVLPLSNCFWMIPTPSMIDFHTFKLLLKYFVLFRIVQHTTIKDEYSRCRNVHSCKSAFTSCVKSVGVFQVQVLVIQRIADMRLITKGGIGRFFIMVNWSSWLTKFQNFDSIVIARLTNDVNFLAINHKTIGEATNHCQLKVLMDISNALINSSEMAMPINNAINPGSTIQASPAWSNRYTCFVSTYKSQSMEDFA